MEERMCQSCVSEGLKACWLKTIMQESLKALPSSKNQTPITEGATITKEAFEVHENIAKDRIHARDERLCPQVNYNPQNPKFQPNL